MSENASAPTTPPSTKYAGDTKRIRIIGGPFFAAQPYMDLKQYECTIDGICQADDLELADTIIYWPSKSLFDRRNIANVLIGLADRVDSKNPPSQILGLRLETAQYPLDSDAINIALAEGFYPYSEPFGPDYLYINGRRHDNPDIQCIKAFRLSPLPSFNSPFAPVLHAITNHIAYAYQHRASLLRGEWPDYYERTRMVEPELFIAVLISALFIPIFNAVQNGAVVAAVVPDECAPNIDIETEQLPHEFSSAFGWLSQSLVYFVNGKGHSRTDTSALQNASPHFLNMARNWCALPFNDRLTFCIGKQFSRDRLKITSDGVFSDNALSPVIFDVNPALLGFGACDNPGFPGAHDLRKPRPSIRYFPLRIDANGNALTLGFQHGTGGMVLMSEPISAEELIEQRRDNHPFRNIELTNKRIPIKGQQELGYIVEATQLSGEINNVPMTVSTFRRFLAFCVAAKRASSIGQSGTIDLTKMTIGDHDLSGVIDPVTQGQGHKPGQLIQEAFEDILDSKHNFIQASPSREKDTRRLHPDFWGIVNFDKLMKQVQKPRKDDTENEDALRIIFSALKQP